MRHLDTLMVVGASNRLPEDDALGALFDRFLLRVRCDNVPQEQLLAVLSAGWRLDVEANGAAPVMHVDDIARLQQGIAGVDLSQVVTPYLELIHRLRHAGIPISDRRAVKLQRMLSASALLCGRTVAHTSDLWVLRYIWDREEQEEVLASLVQDAIDKSEAELEGTRHPRAAGGESADAEVLARDIERISGRITSEGVAATERSYLRDQLGVLAARCQWVTDEQQRTFLNEKIDELWKSFGGEA
jgi:MoxR-like ATPase